MKLFDYSELIRVIDNVEVREKNKKHIALMNLKDKYISLRDEMIESGIFDDWYRLKELCNKAGVRLCVSHQGDASMGIVLGYNDYTYCKEYNDNGSFSISMSSGSSWNDYLGFKYNLERGLQWFIFHATNYHSFNGFGRDEEGNEYQTKIDLLLAFKETYEEYRDYQLKKVEEKFSNRIKTEDILK
jgi:hypothetical protein